MSKKHKKGHKHGEEEAGEAWLLPYSDLMTLLLAVFIVLFAVSQVDQVKADEMAAAFTEGIIVGGAGVFSGEGDNLITVYPDGSVVETNDTGTTDTPSETDTTGTENTDTSTATDTPSAETAGLTQTEYDSLENLKSELDTLFQEDYMTASITTSIDSRGLVVSLNNAILFESGSAEIKSSNEDTLVKIAAIMKELDNYIRIEGHTDNNPINTATFPSNWELSTARASSVVRLFIEKCNVQPEKIVAVGYGEYKPIADNATEEGRAKNRRIDIIVLSEKYNNLEEQIIQE